MGRDEGLNGARQEEGNEETSASTAPIICGRREKEECCPSPSRVRSHGMTYRQMQENICQFSQRRERHTSLPFNSLVEVEEVNGFGFLGISIPENLSWTSLSGEEIKTTSQKKSRICPGLEQAKCDHA